METTETLHPIRRARLLRGWTIKALAARAGVTRQTIYAYEAGQGNSVQMYAKLARALGVPISTLLTPAHGVPA